MSFSNKSHVRIIDSGCFYPIYKTVAKQLQLTKWVQSWPKKIELNGIRGITIGFVIAKNVFGDMVEIYGVYLPEFDKEILISTNGIELVMPLLPEELFEL